MPDEVIHHHDEKPAKKKCPDNNAHNTSCIDLFAPGGSTEVGCVQVSGTDFACKHLPN